MAKSKAFSEGQEGYLLISSAKCAITYPRHIWERMMEYLHTMVRVSNIEESLDFFCNKFGLVEVRAHGQREGPLYPRLPGSEWRCGEGKGSKAPLLELTHNWDEKEYAGGRNFGHLAYRVDDIYETCRKLMEAGVTINRPPRDGYMAFIKSPDNISIELLQRGSRSRSRNLGHPCPTPAPGKLRYRGSLRWGEPNVSCLLAKRPCSAILPGSP